MWFPLSGLKVRLSHKNLKNCNFLRHSNYQRNEEPIHPQLFLVKTFTKTKLFLLLLEPSPLFFNSFFFRLRILKISMSAGPKQKGTTTAQVVCERKTHFRWSLLSLRKFFRRERGDDRKCVCCSQATAQVLPLRN